MLGTLTEAGYRLVQDPAKAEIIVVNTCGFIESAKVESVEAIVELAEWKRSGRCKKLVVAGCLVQRHAEELARELPEVDHFLGTGAYQDIAEVVAGAQAARLVVPDPDFRPLGEEPAHQLAPLPHRLPQDREGCDNACAFCIIPRLRGAQRSRRSTTRRRGRAAGGAGHGGAQPGAQDLTAYGQDLPGKVRLLQLLPELCKVEGIRWIRLHYAYPRDFPLALMEAIAGQPKIVKYLDMPLQHSSDRLLRAMKRGRDSAFLRELLARLRRTVPDLALRTSLIVGLPGETEADFEDLLSFVEAERFERLGVFEYSAEEGTPAATMDGQVPAEVKKERFQRIMGGAARHQPRPPAGHDRPHRRGPGGGARRGDRAPAGRPPRPAGAGDRRPHLHQRRRGLPGRDREGRDHRRRDYDLVGRVVVATPRARGPSCRPPGRPRPPRGGGPGSTSSTERRPIAGLAGGPAPEPPDEPLPRARTGGAPKSGQPPAPSRRRLRLLMRQRLALYAAAATGAALLLAAVLFALARGH